MAVTMLVPSAKAEPFEYKTRLIVTSTGNSEMGMIVPADVSIGDFYNVTFWVDPFVAQSLSLNNAATFNNVLLSFSLTPGPDNTGSFVPNIFGVTGDVNIFGENSQTVFEFFFNFPLAGQADYIADYYGLSGEATMTSIGIILKTDQPFADGGVDTPLGEYLPASSLSLSGGTNAGGLYFNPDNTQELVPITVVSDVQVVPEPSTYALLLVGAGALYVRRRRRV